MREHNGDEGGAGFGCLGFILGIVLGVLHFFITVNSIGNLRGSSGTLLFSLLFYIFYMVLLYWLLRESKPAAATGLVIGAVLIGLLGVSCANILRQL